MYIDKQLLFSRDQTLTADEVSDNVVDFKQARNIGVGENLYLVVLVKTVLTGTLQVNIEMDDAVGFPSAVITDIGTFAANAVAGSRLIHRLNPDVINEQFMRLDLNGVSAGAVDAFITGDIQADAYFPIGYTVTG